METRNKEILKLLKEKKFFKLDLNSIKNELLIKNLTYLFTLSGCSAIDLDYNLETQKTIRKSIAYALEDLKKFTLKEIKVPSLVISFTEKLLDLEEQKLSDFINKLDLQESDIIELHIDKYSLDKALECLKKIKNLSINKILSISLNRDKLSNASIIDLIKFAREFAGNNLIIEVNGNFESKNKNSFNNSLQTLSTADIIFKQLINKELKFRRLPLLIAGGTNSHTKKLAHQCGINYNGITFGEYVIDMIPKKYLESSITFNYDLLLESIKIKSFIEGSLQS